MLRDRGAHAAAEALLLDVYATLHERYGDAHRETRSVVERLVALYEAWGRPAEAARYRSRLTAE